MNINPDDPKWTAYVLGELDDAERAEIERLIESSEEARALVDELRIAATMLKDEFATQPEVALTAEQQRAIHAAAGDAKTRRFAFPALRWAAAFGVAASVLLVVFLYPRQHIDQIATNLPQAAPAGAIAGSADATTVEKDSYRAEKPREAQESSRSKAAAADRDIADLSALRDGKELKQATLQEPQQGQQGQQGKKEEFEKSLSRIVAPGAGGGIGTGRGVVNGLQVGEMRVNTAFAPTVVAAPPPPPASAPRPIVADRLDAPRQFNTETYDRITDNPFIRVAQDQLATFSIDVDTASYANVRRFLTQNQLPPKDAVRIEELINYFSYDYRPPTGAGAHPIAASVDAASAPWEPTHRLVRIGIKGKEIDISRRQPSNLVFLIDVSGSMAPPERLPLLKSGMKLLVDRLGEGDHVSIVTYAGASGVALQPTTGDKKELIARALDNLESGGSTNGASGIRLAYDLAVSNFIRGGVNRVILATDGDFNVGVTNQGDLTRLIEDRAKSGVFLSVLGFGMGNLKDSTMEKLADTGNGNYSYIDTLNEARKVLVEEMAGTLLTIAKDVKIQVEFNPAQVNAYRLIGYENRVLRAEDFNNDLKDAGDMGSGHTVTALFDVVPRGVDVPTSSVDQLKYQTPAQPATRAASSNEMLTVKIRYKDPDASESKLFDVPFVDSGAAFARASQDFRFAASVAEFGMILRDSPYKGSASMASVLDLAEQSKGADRGGYRAEFIELVRRARALGR